MANCKKVYFSDSSEEEEISIVGQYHLEDIIGYGSFGYVKVAHHRLTDTRVAVKFLLKKDLKSHAIENEVDIVKSIHHPHIIQLFQVMEDEEAVYLVMELATRGHLMGRILKSSCCRLFEHETRRLFKQIVSAVQYLHENGIAHRDLKPNNILLDAKYNAKVSDFGLSVRMTPGQLIKGACGALTFRPPEMFLHKMYDAYKMDIWVLGVLLYVMTSGTFPFEGRKFADIQVLVVEAKYNPPLYLSSKGHNLLSQLLTVDSSQRPNIEQIMEHPWLSLDVECGLGPDEPLPSKLDPIIVAVMCDMGYNAAETQESVLDRAFNEAMGTYLVIRENLKQNAGPVKLRRMPLHVPPCPTPEEHAPSPLPPRRRSSLPARRNSFSLSSEFQWNDDGTQTPVKRGRSASLPAIPLCFLPSSSSSRIRGQFSFDQLSRLESCQSEENALPSGQPLGWRRVADRIVTVLHRLCCCVKAPK